MKTKRQRDTRQKKQNTPLDTSKSIAEQTKVFLQAGGCIQYIQPGISGQPSMTLIKASSWTSGRSTFKPA